MKGEDLIQIATTVYGIKWFDSLCAEMGITDKELSAMQKSAEDLPGPVQYALRDIVSKYMTRIESMQINSKFQDALLNGEVKDESQAAFMAGMLKGMMLVLSSTHGEPEELRALALEEDFQDVVEGYTKKAS